MKEYGIILFDLDGTLTDSGEGITNSVAYALGKFGIEVQDKTTLRKFIGPPLWESFSKYYGLSDAEARQAVEYYREYYRDKGIYENRLYDGMKELLTELAVSGKRIMLATSKPYPFAKRILEYFGIAGLFFAVAGANLDGTLTDKKELIEYALGFCGADVASEAVMVGDREYDIFGARKAGIDSIGVLYGFGSRAELEAAGAGSIAASVTELGEMLLPQA